MVKFKRIIEVLFTFSVRSNIDRICNLLSFHNFRFGYELPGNLVEERCGYLKIVVDGPTYDYFRREEYLEEFLSIVLNYKVIIYLLPAIEEFWREMYSEDTVSITSPVNEALYFLTTIGADEINLWENQPEYRNSYDIKIGENIDNAGNVENDRNVDNTENDDNTENVDNDNNNENNDNENNEGNRLDENDKNKTEDGIPIKIYNLAFIIAFDLREKYEERKSEYLYIGESSSGSRYFSKALKSILDYFTEDNLYHLEHLVSLFLYYKNELAQAKMEKEKFPGVSMIIEEIVNCLPKIVGKDVSTIVYSFL